MKSLTSLYLFVILVMVLAASLTILPLYDMQKVIAQSLKVSEQSLKFRVNEPPGWEKIRGNSSDNLIIFRAPRVNGTGVGIYATDLPYSNISFSEYTTIQIKSLNQTYNLLQHNATSLLGLPAYQAVYADVSKGTTALEIWTIKEDIVFKIIYLANSNYFKDYLGPAHSIIMSFQLISK